ncbi:MAG TPA: RNA polymerase sigma factor [Streptosporangiaceae bacterium]
MTDPLVTARPEAGDFGEIFDAYFVEIHRYVARRLDRDIADDVAAETFSIAFRRRDVHDPRRGPVRPWLYGIATNLIAKHRRAEARRLKAVQLLDPGPKAETGEEGTLDRLAAEAVRPRLARALAGLPPRQRDVLLLVALGGLTYEEVAQALDIPYGTVCSRFSRARAQIREALGGTNPTSAQEDFDG